jgi:hypothetical protein
MKKKYLVIELLDGTMITEDWTNRPGAPFGAGANDGFYAGVCMAIAANGYTDIREGARPIDATFFRHIAPSQIVAVCFEFKDNHE